MALRPHRIAAAAALGIALLTGACASPVKPAVAPAAEPLVVPASPASVKPTADPTTATATTPPPKVTRPPATTARRPNLQPTTTPPRKGAPQPAATACPATLASELASTAGAAQLVTVAAPASGSTTASMDLWQRSGGCWSLVAGPWPARVGVTGVSDHHREGDGSTPAGLYRIGSVMYGIAANPGVRSAYHQLSCGDWWDEDPASATYNTFQQVACGAAPPFRGKSEALWQETTAYQHFAVVDYNADPVVPGAGSAVFIHDDTGRPTIGCVSVAPSSLLRLLGWLDPSQAPAIVIGTETEIRRF